MGRWGVEEVSEAPEKTPYKPLGDMVTKVWDHFTLNSKYFSTPSYKPINNYLTPS